MGDAEVEKALLPYIRRANEVQKYEPLVAYHCRLYAKNRLIKIPLKKQSSMINDMLSSLTEQLAKDLESIQCSSTDSIYINKFALRLFKRADKQERFGKADIRTAKTFYAASLFFEILVNFRDLQPDVLEKQQYAAWRAAEIFKASKVKSQKVLKEERQSPVSLPASANTSTNLNDRFMSPALNSGQSAAETLSNEFSTVGQKNGVLRQEQIPSSDTIFCEPSSDSILPLRVVASSATVIHLDKEEPSDDDEAFYDCSDAELSPFCSSDAEHESDSTCNVSVDVVNESNHPSATDIAKAQKLARLAVSALASNDVPSAVSYLQQALTLLTNSP